MKAVGRVVSAVTLFGAVAGQVWAEPLYQVEVSQLNAETLFEQTLTESGVVTVKPQIPTSATGDIRVLDQCLWSVKIELGQQEPVLAPGKMICVGPNQEVLETIPQGVVASFGNCVDNSCSSWTVDGNVLVDMQLSSPLAFTLQPRNERQ